MEVKVIVVSVPKEPSRFLEAWESGILMKRLDLFLMTDIINLKRNGAQIN